nr:hypothetical protein [uncultured Acetatifactor sp.]
MTRNLRRPGELSDVLSTGEPPASNYPDPELIKALVQSVEGLFIISQHPESSPQQMD